MSAPMHHSRVPFAGLLVALFMAGCATAPPIAESCPETNWFQAGRDDGLRGVPPKQLAEHVAACAKGGVTLDTSDYLPGWNEGIGLFCNAQSGWKQGVIGNPHKLEACAGQPDEAAYKQYLVAGQEVFKLNEQRRANAAQLQKLNQQSNVSKDPLERRKLKEQMAELDKAQVLLRRQLGALQAKAPL